MSTKNQNLVEFGDFQTPDNLALSVINLVKKQGIKPLSIIEPTCGQGAFILASIDNFTDVKTIVGVDINKTYVDELYHKIEAFKTEINIKIIHHDFFTFNWDQLLNQLPDPILIMGNPPWITNSRLGKISSNNLPEKSNFQALNGLDALTGKSNFDLSEWMILQQIEWLKNRQGTIAMLCKTAVARKVLLYAWKHNYPIDSAYIYSIDALRYFNASVDACLLLLNIKSNSITVKQCYFYDNLSQTKLVNILGYDQHIIISNWEKYQQFKHLYGTEKSYLWRSGIKHDCSKVMELNKTETGYQNGYRVNISLEDTYIYPLLKSSDLANGRITQCRKYVIVTQKTIGEETNSIQVKAPKTWQYLQHYANLFEKRKSAIYKNRPAFSIFGIGDYTFSPWKVAISGFYKHLTFIPVSLIEGKPAIFDDTIYFLPCYCEKQAQFLADLLNSEPAQQFFNSMIFWTDKRPITINILRRMVLQALARELKQEKEYLFYLK